MVHPRYIRQPGGRATGPATNLPVVIVPPPSPPTALTLAITTTTLAALVATVAYSQAIASSGTAGIPTFTVASGALPAGLVLDPGGVISGIPTTAGAYTFTLRATASGVAAIQTFSGAVTSLPVPALTLTITTTTLPSPVTTVPYNQTIQTSGTAGAPTFSVVSGALPEGLALNASTGTISGTPATAVAYNFTVLATASGINDTQAYSGTVGAGLTITTNALATPVVADAYSQTITTAGGSGTPTLSISAGALPDGLTLDGSTGAITGVPTTEGAFSFTVQATDGVLTVTKVFSGNVAARFLITTTSLPTPVIGVAYNQTILTAGGVGNLAFSLAAGALPAGLALSATGAITGTPTTASAYGFTVRATRGRSVDTQAFSGTVLAPLVITTTTLPAPVVGVAYSQTIATTGGASAPVFSISAGALPAGLVLGSSTGTISGTPTTGGAYSFTVRATDGVSSPTRAFSGTVTVIIPPLTITTTGLAAPTAGVFYSQTIATAGGVTAPTFAVSAGALPVGLGLNNTTGVISGTATTAGAYSFTIRASDGVSSPTQAYSGSVAAPPPPPLAITTTSLPPPVVNVAYSQLIATTGGSGTPTFSISAGSLPAGLSLNTTTGRISGTPTTAAVYNFTVMAVAGTTATQAYTLTVSAPPPPPLAITTTSLPDPVVSVAYSQTINTSGGAALPTFSISAGVLPAGLAIDSSTGVISGTPTASGAYSYTVQATDGTTSPTQAFSGTVGVIVPPIAITTTTLPNPMVGTAYSQTIHTSGGTGSPVFAISAGTLVAGLALNTATGVISGTPTTATSYTFTVRATAGTVDTQAYTVTVAPAPPPPPPPYDPMTYLARGFVADRLALDDYPANSMKNSPYTAADMAVWQSVGITHIRIPIAYSGILTGQKMAWDSSKLSDATTVKQFFDYIDLKAAQFIAAGFNVLFCPFMNKDDRIAITNAGKFPATLFSALDAIVSRYHGLYDRTQCMFELWNEPYYPNVTVLKDGTVLGPGYMYTDYNALYPQLINIVRSYTRGPNSHTIMLDTPQSAKSQHLPFLTPPSPFDPDNNLIVAVHKYDPEQLCNEGYGDPINPAIKYPRAANDPGTAIDPNWSVEYDKNRLLNDSTTDGGTGIQLAKNWSVTHNQRIYYGEFGCTGYSDAPSRQRWHTDMIAIFKSLGIPWALWSAAGHKFGIRPPQPVLAGINRNLGAAGTFYAGYDMDIINVLLASK